MWIVVHDLTFKEFDTRDEAVRFYYKVSQNATENVYLTRVEQMLQVNF